jgi:hypothetical protein
MWGIIAASRRRFKDIVQPMIDAFKERVLANFGLYEAELCLLTQLTDLNNNELLEDASLIITPNGYKENALYTVSPNDGSGDLTVTRAGTSATRVNADGLVEIVPYNLATKSEAFESSGWSRTGLTVSPSYFTAPNGSNTAQKVIENASTGLKFAARVQLIPNTIIGSIYTLSFYVKAQERTWCYITFGNDSTIPGDRAAYFNLADGTIGNIENGVTPQISSEGNGWYRCSITGFNDGTEPRGSVAIAQSNGVRNYTGDGTSGILVWGAQMVEGTEPKEYLPTDNRTNIPRIDYFNKTCPRILVEPSATNRLLRSNEFSSDTSWNKISSSVIKNVEISPSGILDADKYVQNDIPNTNARLRQNVTFPVNSVLTWSLWVKADNFDIVNLTINSSGVFIRAAFQLIGNGVILGTQTNSATFGNAKIESYPNSWYRVSITGNYNDGQTSAECFIRVGESYGVLLGGSVFVWGAQFEVGSRATTYIPTTTQTTVRNNDTITKTSALDLIGQTEGSIFIDFYYEDVSIDQLIFIRETNFNYLFRARVISGNFSVLYFNQPSGMSGAASFTNTVALSPNTRNKVLIVYNGATQKTRLFCNGSFIGETTLAFPLPLNQDRLDIGITFSATVKELNNVSIWKKQLTDTQCINLTTL